MKKNRPPKMILNNALLEEEFFEEVALIGMVCPMRSHRFVWEVNKGFDISFHREHELQIEIKEDLFPVYVFDDHLKQTEHFIFSNRGYHTFLLPEAKNIDFIWMIKSGSFLREEKEHVISGLSQLQSIQYVAEMDASSLTSRSLLII